MDNETGVISVPIGASASHALRLVVKYLRDNPGVALTLPELVGELYLDELPDEQATVLFDLMRDDQRLQFTTGFKFEYKRYTGFRFASDA